MKFPYKHTFLVEALAPGVTLPAKINMDKGVDFVAEEISAVGFETLAGITKAAEVMPLVAINFKENQGAGEVFDIAAPLANVAGTGENPHVLGMPIRFKGNTSPQMSATNFSSDKTYARVYVTLHGYRETDEREGTGS